MGLPSVRSSVVPTGAGAGRRADRVDPQLGGEFGDRGQVGSETLGGGGGHGDFPVDTSIDDAAGPGLASRRCRESVPAHVRRELAAKLRRDSEQAAADHCQGTLLSATQYLRDVDLGGYRDARLSPLGTMSHEEIAIWSANFMKPK